MKKLLLLISFVVVATYASAQKTATIICSQGFQGPELWDRHEFPVDKKGFITIFDGKTFAGWRGYGKPVKPAVFE